MNKVSKNLFAGMQKIAAATMRTACNLKFVKLVTPICFFLICTACSNKNEQEDVKTLKGTKWKLESIVDAEIGDLKVLEPKDCIECYTIIFEADSFYNETTWFNGIVKVEPGWYKIFEGHSSSNLILTWYSIDYDTGVFHIYNIGGTEVMEHPDGNLFRDALLAVQSFSLQEKELRLYYSGNKKYLLFKPLK